MKVHSLWLGDYRVLRDCAIQFSPASRRSSSDTGTAEPATAHALDLLVGVNGTGKSTALRALVDVLRRIERKTSSDDLLFRITFESFLDHLVTITNVDEKKQKLVGKFRVWSGPSQVFEELDDVSQFAPGPYVTYTTGLETMREGAREDADPTLLTEATQGEYWLREQPGGDSPPATPAALEPATNSGQRHFDITAQDLPLVTLCGLLQASMRPGVRGIVDDALDEIGIARLGAFTLRFRIEPGAGGPRLDETLAALRKAASRARVQGSAQSFVFDVRGRGAEVLEKLRAAFQAESPVGLFRELAAHTRAQGGFRPVLPRVEMFIERKPPGVRGAPAPELHTYDWLSDGERTFLARMCLLALFGAADALILLDEPEVHFNDYWKRKLVRLVDRALADHHSHAIITTHSSIVLTDARMSQITVLDRSRDGYTRWPVNPGVPTYAGDPSDVLVNVFGAEAAAGAKSTGEVGDVLFRFERALRAGKKHELKSLGERLESLEKELAPGYWRYRVAEALSRRLQTRAAPTDAAQA